MKHLLLAAAAASLALPVTAQEPVPNPSPGEIAAAAPVSDWVAIAPSELLVMDLAPDATGKARRVVIQLMPAPFSQGWIGNIRKLAAAHWWDGTSINRVQDNYVVQWGDATEKKALPEGLMTVPESGYVTTSDAISEANAKHLDLEGGGESALAAALGAEAAAVKSENNAAQFSIDGTRTKAAPGGWHERDSYTSWVEIFNGWPVAAEQSGEGVWHYWPVHCYGAVGVGRNMSPDTGSGAELYTVIGEAPRHLDRNIALVGRVITGMEYLTSLPRGTGALGFYEDAAQRVPIRSIRMANELSQDDQPKFEVLSTDSVTFHRYVEARANRRDPFFIKPAGGVGICNIPVPVRMAPK